MQIILRFYGYEVFVVIVIPDVVVSGSDDDIK